MIIKPSKPIIGKREKSKGDPARRRGRKRADVIVAEAVRTGRPSNRQAVWDYIRAHARGFDLEGIVRKTDIHQRTVESYLEGLAKAGYIAAEGKTPHCYKLMRDTGVEAPRVKSDGSPARSVLGQEAIWRSMRTLKTFDKHDLAETSDVPLRTAQSYLTMLLPAGYLRIVMAGKPGHAARYQLILNTGPRPPMIQRVKQVFDPNLGKVVWAKVEGARDDF